MKTNITLDLNKVGLWYFKLAPQSVLNYEVAPTNNLASNIYSDELYSQKSKLTTIILVLTGASFVLFFVGLVWAKIAVSEMMGVMQIAYFGIFVVNFSDPLI